MTERDESECAALRHVNRDQSERLLKTEHECAALRAEVERLTGIIGQLQAGAMKLELERATVSESRLAAANALLGRCQQVVSPVSLLGRDLDAHLAAQPATAPTRTEAEQRVLDAVKRAVDAWDANDDGPPSLALQAALEALRSLVPGQTRTDACEWGPHCPACREEDVPPAVAELARREAK